MARHPFDNRTRFRLVAPELGGDNLIVEGLGHDADSAFDALIAYANANTSLGITRTGATTAVTAGGTALVLEA